VAESHAARPGGEAMLARMSEMMFVDAVRRYADRLPPQSAGWLAGLRDRFVGRALGLMHEQPAQDWTIDELGRRVGLSRSSLHERFVQLIGVPPMQYLAQWRMQAAARMLLETCGTVATIALDVGYESEAAFARAFKRLVGRPPAAWRRERSAALA
jgi:transcriptional regulator GlxA family with amidase domain